MGLPLYKTLKLIGQKSTCHIPILECKHCIDSSRNVPSMLISLATMDNNKQCWVSLLWLKSQQLQFSFCFYHCLAPFKASLNAHLAALKTIVIRQYAKPMLFFLKYGKVWTLKWIPVSEQISNQTGLAPVNKICLSAFLCVYIFWCIVWTCEWACERYFPRPWVNLGHFWGALRTARERNHTHTHTSNPISLFIKHST